MITIHHLHTSMDSAAERRTELAKPQDVWFKLAAAHTDWRHVRQSKSENDDETIPAE